MNEQPKSKILIMIIGILLLANIVMLAFFIFNTKHNDERKERNDKPPYVKEYLKKEVGFSDQQLAQYDTLSKKHREQIKSSFKELSAGRKNILDALAAASFSDSAIKIAASTMHERQKVIELSMLTHLKDIRDLCTETQRLRFDTGFYKIFGRRDDSHKEK